DQPKHRSSCSTLEEEFAAATVLLCPSALCKRPLAAGYRGSDFVLCAAFSDAEMLGSPHSRTVGVGEAPRHEVAAIGALGYNGRYGDLIGAQALIVGSR